MTQQDTYTKAMPDNMAKESRQVLSTIFVDTPQETRPAPEPIRQGVPLPRSAVIHESHIQIVDDDGKNIARQTRVLARWADGSIKWLLVDFLHSVDATDADRRFNYRLVRTKASSSSPDHSSEGRSAWSKIKIGEECGGTPFALFSIDNVWTAELKVRLIDGRELTLRSLEQKVLETGPIRSVTEFTGTLIDAHENELLTCRLEVHMVNEVSLLRCTLTLSNPAQATHPGGIWELGDPSSVEIADASFVVRPTNHQVETKKSTLRWAVDGTNQLESSPLPWSLYQDSSGGENWNCSNHVDKNGQVPLKLRGFELRAGNKANNGNRANPVIEYGSGTEWAMAISCPQFWENFPKALTVDSEGLRFSLFPQESGREHELQPGEQKTHQFWLAGPLNQEATDSHRTAIGVVHRPSRVTVDCKNVSQSEAVPWLTPANVNSNQPYDSLVSPALEGDDTFIQKREVIDEYGWRHFGDIYGDHEAVFSEPTPPLISHYNNQYDAVLGFGIQFLRGGDTRWAELMRDLAWHVVDIDIYHARTDKGAYNGGQFWHTFHYIDAGTATHRSYPTGTCGGGPASEQGYARGLGLYYYLTGEEMMRQTVDRLGEWIIAADDGSTTPFRWLSKQGTGLTSASGTLDYQGPGRGAGNAIEVSVAAFEVTGKQKYLDEAEKLIRRVIHPHDDIESRNLLDAERRWYYTLFLQSLGRYLLIKHQLGQHDFMYGYGRACLLHYATWMTDREYPYLEKPEILEYPTETWAAQDMRKSEVFQWASLHCAGELRERFLERAQYFYEYSTCALSEMETRTLCRPVVLLLSNGYSRECFKHADSIPLLPEAADVVVDYGQPKLFVPQRIQAIARAKTIAVLGAGLMLLTLVASLFMWWNA